MRQATLCTAGAIAFTFLMACCAYSQTLNIWPGGAPRRRSFAVGLRDRGSGRSCQHRSGCRHKTAGIRDCCMVYE